MRYLLKNKRHKVSFKVRKKDYRRYVIYSARNRINWFFFVNVFEGTSLARVNYDNKVSSVRARRKMAPPHRHHHHIPEMPSTHATKSARRRILCNPHYSSSPQKYIVHFHFPQLCTDFSNVPFSIRGARGRKGGHIYIQMLRVRPPPPLPPFLLSSHPSSL